MGHRGSDGAPVVDVYPREGAGRMNEYADLTWVSSVMWRGIPLEGLLRKKAAWAAWYPRFMLPNR